MVAPPSPMRRFFRTLRFALIAWIAVIGAVAHAAVTMQLNTLQVEENERILLTLRIDRNDADKEPDFSALEKDFSLLNRPSRSSQFQSINGRITAWTDWKLYIQPKRAGRVVVPPITYEGETTLPQSILVTPLDPSVKRDLQQRVFFETSTSPEDPYVQAQITFVRRLLYSEGTQIYGEIPDTPKIENAVVVQLGTPTSRAVERFGQRYSMIEQRYAIFPESSGTLTIPRANVTGSVRTIINQRIRRNSLSVTADPITLNVRPIPASYPADQPWFPARDVQVIDAWDADPLVFRVGEPISQSIIVSSSGTTGSIIPPVDYELPSSHFRIYPEQPDISDNPSANDLQGVRSQNFSLIPITAGTTQLPRIKVTWWDTESDQLRIAELPMRSITISGESVIDNPATTADSSSANSSTDLEPDSSATGAEGGDWRALAPWLIGTFLLVAGVIWLIKVQSSGDGKSIYGWYAQRRARSPKVALMALQRSIAADTAQDIRQALTNYIATLKPKQQPIDDTAVREFQAQLSAVTYAPNDRPLERQQLGQLAQALRLDSAIEGDQPLPALYKQRA